MNLHENLMQETCARNLCKFLAQVSWLCVTTITQTATPAATTLFVFCKYFTNQHSNKKHWYENNIIMKAAKRSAAKTLRLELLQWKM